MAARRATILERDVTRPIDRLGPVVQAVMTSTGRGLMKYPRTSAAAAALLGFALVGCPGTVDDFVVALNSSSPSPH